MKKLLTVSLVAVMAVSAAHADIASTKYVTDRTGNLTELDAKFKDAQGNMPANLTAAVNKAIELSGSSLEGLDIDEAAGESGVTTNYVNYVTQADGKVTAEATEAGTTKDAIAENNNKLVTGSAVYGAIDALDVASTTVADGKVITAYSEVDGKISLATADGSNAVASDDSKLITSKGVYATTGTVSELGEAAKDANGVKPTTLAQAIKNVSDTAVSLDKLDMTAVGSQTDKSYYVHYAMEENGVVTATAQKADSEVTEGSSNLVTSGAVHTAVDTVTDAVAGKQDKSKADFTVGTANGAWVGLTDTLPEACKAAGTVCALVSNNGKVAWDIVASEVTTDENGFVAPKDAVVPNAQ